jgi:hypothetical protein
MNERIDKLIEQCTRQNFSDCVGGFETFDKEKFAELIVRECLDVCKSETMVRYAAEVCASRIKEHFGVEE